MRKRKATVATGFLIATAWACAASRLADAEMHGPRIEGVKTTAYSGCAEDNGPYGCKNALGRPLKSGVVTSAAADWSRYPVGTRFRVVETGQQYIVDDYGSALVGTGTIDLYKTTDAQVDRWGVRHVTIEILEWGSPGRSLRILRERGKMRHIREMVQSLQDQESA
ncbi:MAG: 3D domain-containing protein [Terrimicrobiaceae bacterium]|nr:3D domain-containing protein [Terrimicrobiaceae bacterium]